MDVSNLIQMTPWDRYAGVCGALTTIVCLLIGFVALFVNDGAWHVFAALYTVGVGFLVAVIELPALYCHSYACIKLKDRLIEDTSFHHGWIRASLYVACTPAMLGFKSILIWPGVQLLVCAALYILVSIKYRISSGPSTTGYSNFDQGCSKVATADAGAEEEGPSFGTFTL
ncbi:hypothetical protein JL720_254 [Aureococcus anophagefferens]|nr:hypothetical protein JL720_254 [Aureococcus anophagefferens]